jgi:hypothetical protein
VATLLDGRFEGCDIASSQISGVLVADDCGCGCISLKFAVRQAAPSLPKSWRQDFSAVDESGGNHSLILVADGDGRIGFLDHVFWDGKQPRRFPVESIRVCDYTVAGPTRENVVPRENTIHEEKRLNELSEDRT